MIDYSTYLSLYVLTCVCYCVNVCVCAEWGSTKTGEQEDLIMTALNCVLKVPQYLPQEQRFDIRVLVSLTHSHTHTGITICVLKVPAGG